MKPERLLDSTATPGGDELLLYERDGVFTLRIGGIELMTSRAHDSEEELSRMAMKLVDPRLRPPEVVRWNRDHLAELAGRPLEDSRVSIVERDLYDVIADSPRAFDVILIDVDNGPSGCSWEHNERLYRAAGLSKIRRSLRPKGVLGVWCAEPDPRFEKALSSAGFRAHSANVYARNVSKGHAHTVFIGQLP